ncbi:HEAT repeat domain-containing protein [Actinoplanes awajinensis]|uniref:PBS lyase n=1 Tax=Actinoplanes awajinensis subsp. mycoplanecinus TaxID=135947 RepID=A0A0X3UVH6_9ACTN|nr:HEAT repeat domain-containing protein [Actinoplanes awajinensis]KUL35832.1 PBS lyase [Actinoplanes awajinensis subsp. mycoplanecinus]
MGLVGNRAPAPLAEVRPASSSSVELLRCLDDQDPERRREAAMDLAGVPEVVPDLLARLGREADHRVRVAVLTTLAAQDTERVAAGLAVHLASDEADLRTAVAEALSTMTGSVPALLPSLLAAPDRDVRLMTVVVLAGLPQAAAQPWLVQMISEDPDPNVVAAAIGALLEGATVMHAPVIEAAARRFPNDPFLSFAARMSLPPLAGTAWWRP